MNEQERWAAQQQHFLEANRRILSDYNGEIRRFLEGYGWHHLGTRFRWCAHSGIIILRAKVKIGSQFYSGAVAVSVRVFFLEQRAWVYRDVARVIERRIQRRIKRKVTGQ